MFHSLKIHVKHTHERLENHRHWKSVWRHLRQILSCWLFRCLDLCARLLLIVISLLSSPPPPISLSFASFARIQSYAEWKRERKKAKRKKEKRKVLYTQAKLYNNIQKWLSLPPSLSLSLPLFFSVPSANVDITVQCINSSLGNKHRKRPNSFGT